MTQERKGYQYIDSELMDRVAVEAHNSPRKRMNYNFHASTDEPVNRLLNVMHRGSYLPVHRHLSPARSESIAVLRGRVGVLFYDDEGNLTDKRKVGPACDCVGFDIDAGPILLELSPSGTAFFAGPASYFDDTKVENAILRTAEAAGHTVVMGHQRHYLLANVALVGESIMLAMRTHR